MAIFATAGTSVYIGGPINPKPIPFVVGDFGGDSWVEVGWLESIGGFGDESSEVTFDAISEGRTQKLKGVRNAGTMELVAGIDYSDAGQIQVRAAELSPLDYTWQVEFNDMPAGGATNSKRYFIGKVMSVREVLDGANNVMRLNVSVGINSNVVRVNAT